MSASLHLYRWLQTSSAGVKIQDFIRHNANHLMSTTALGSSVSALTSADTVSKRATGGRDCVGARWVTDRRGGGVGVCPLLCSVKLVALPRLGVCGLFLCQRSTLHNRPLRLPHCLALPSHLRRGARRIILLGNGDVEEYLFSLFYSLFVGVWVWVPGVHVVGLRRQRKCERDGATHVERSSTSANAASAIRALGKGGKGGMAKWAWLGASTLGAGISTWTSTHVPSYLALSVAVARDFVPARCAPLLWTLPPTISIDSTFASTLPHSHSYACTYSFSDRGRYY
ncbi:hypothetical protein MSAN_01824200 [Mycena sanguinolenta]|uniref:Uncharacterized protein n=1 Tax=Mycena sanguinolenta TaxID=230812 RepID=A0A8H6XV49_9AGAR|nr:hypothetical protein MSAN_01824200 [Mycena sanguinolenta]